MLEKLSEIIREHLQISQNIKITEDTSFKQDLRADSYELMELVMALEEEYGIRVADEDIENLETVGDVIDYIVGQDIDQD